MIKNELQAIKITTQKKLDIDVEILGLTTTAFSHHVTYMQRLIDTTARMQPHVTDHIFAWSYLRVIETGLKLNDAISLDYPPGTDIDEENAHILHIDYQDTAIRVSMTSVGKQTLSEVCTFRVGNFGDRKQGASV